jgi:histidyl-tRNA synthetase
MAQDQGPLSGFRDLLSSQMIAREQVLDSVRSTYELYGFMPLKTPAIERFETLTGKYGEEASTLIYDFEDRGKRHIALRYDHTVPLARLMATRLSSLPSPYKRYVIGDVWRGESPQAGRYREFTQIDADIVGSDSYLADTEILAMVHDVFKALELEVSINVNDRRILDGLAEKSGITGQEKFNKFVGIIDKIDKIGEAQVNAEIEQAFGAQASELVSKLLSAQSDEAFSEVEKLIDNPKATAGIESLKSIFKALEGLEIHDVKFNPTIARGLDYYTSTVFETTLNKLAAIGSVCSGGRYDKLIETLGGPDSPAVGASIGLDRLMEAVSQLGDHGQLHTKTKAYIVNLDAKLNDQRLALAHKLRNEGIPTEIYYPEAKLGKQLEAIDKLGVNKVIIYGQNEHEKSVALIKDLKTSDQKEVSLDKLVEELKKTDAESLSK